MHAPPLLLSQDLTRHALQSNNLWWHKLDVWISYQQFHMSHRSQRGGRDRDRWTYCRDNRSGTMDSAGAGAGWKTCVTCSATQKFRPGALTSLNSWICACSNMENTLELAPSAVLLLAFLGAYWEKGCRHTYLSKSDVNKYRVCMGKNQERL